MANKRDAGKLDLPEVKDIPGQEHVRPPRLGELADSTASSSDEEGDDILDATDEDILDSDTDVSPQEKKVLEDVDYRKAESEDQPLIEGKLDDTDDDGDPLNEDDDDLSGNDLDIPGAEDDDLDESLGEEDEENNDYSLSDDDDDNEHERD